MSNPRRIGLLLLALLVLGAGGCGGGGKTKKAKGAKPLVPAEVDADAAVRVDDGRITVAPPMAWSREPRSASFLARYVPRPGRRYPSVTVFGGDPPAGITAVDAANHADFVAAVADSVASPGGTVTLLKRPAAATLGPHKAVVWSAPDVTKVDGMPQAIERYFAVVVVAGRMYTVEARAPKDKLSDSVRSACLGVAAGIAEADEEPPAGAPEEKPAADDAPQPETEPAAAAAPPAGN